MIGQVQDVEVAFTVGGVPLNFKLKKQIYPAGMHFYNWGTLDDHEKKVADGHIRGGNINFVFQRGDQTTGFYNNGFYLSTNPADSELFGGFGLCVDLNVPGGTPFLDLSDIFATVNEQDLIKLFIARGYYAQEDEKLIELHNANLLKNLEKQKEKIGDEVFNLKKQEILDKKYTPSEISTIREQMLKKARKSAVCDIIDAMGHEKLRELGVVGVQASKQRPNWVCLVTDAVDHRVRMMDSSDFQMGDPKQELLKLQKEHQAQLDKLKETLSGDEYKAAVKDLEKSYHQKRREIKQKFQGIDWTKTLPEGNQLQYLFAVDAKIPIDQVTLGSISAVKEKLYKDPMSSSDIQQLLDDYGKAITGTSVWDPHVISTLNPAEYMDNNLQNRAQKQSPPYIKTPLQEELYKVITNFLKNNPTYKMPPQLAPFYARLQEMHKNGLTVEERELRTHFLRNGPINDDFLKKLMYGLNFIDSYDYLRKMALKDPAPWAAYDPWKMPGHNMSKWQSAMKIPYRTKEQVMKPTDGIIEVFKIFREATNIEFRGHAVTAGGAFDKTGKLMTGATDEGQGYFRATKEQVEVLKNHPFLKNIDAIEVDPAVGGAAFVVRYDYPDARDYEKFKDIAPETYQAIQAEIERLNAEGKNGKAEIEKLLAQVLPSQLAGEIERSGKNPYDLANIDEKHHVSVKFTQMLVKELFKSLDDPKITAEQRYQRMLTLHPFFDTNGRSARAFYQLETGKPFMLKNWDEDITLKPEQLKSEIDAEIADWVRFVGEFKKESTQAYIERRPPSYYEQPQIWLRHAKIDPNQYNKDEQRMIMFRLMDIFKSDEFYKLQEKKAWFDVQELIQREIKPVLENIKAARLEQEIKAENILAKHQDKRAEVHQKLEQKGKEAKEKGKAVLADIAKLKPATEQPARVGGVVDKQTSAASRKLQEPQMREKATAHQKKRNRAQAVRFHKANPKAVNVLIPHIAAHSKKQKDAQDAIDKIILDEVLTLSIGISQALLTQAQILKEKVDDHANSNPFSKRLVNFFYSSYVKDLGKETIMLQKMNETMGGFKSALKENIDKKDYAGYKETLEKMKSFCNESMDDLKNKKINEIDTGTNLSGLLDSLAKEIDKIEASKWRLYRGG